MKKVSLIVPVYNGEQYAKRSVAMLKAQDYPNLEIVVINDGSTDKTAVLLESLIGEDERFFVISQENTGLSGARNRGIKEAHGDYICFCDFDDYIYPFYVSHLVDVAQKTGAEVVCGTVMRLLPDEQPASQNSMETLVSYSGKSAVIDMLHHKHIQGYAVGKLYLSYLVKTKEFPTVPRIEDSLFNYDILRCVERVVYSNRVIYLYYQNATSLVQAGKGKNLRKAWNAYVRLVLSDAHRTDESTLKAAISHGFVMASDMLAQMGKTDYGSKLYQVLYRYVKRFGKTVMKDSDSKALNRLMGTFATAFPKFYIHLCRIFVSLSGKYGFVKKTAV